jgi:hypothetical protein
MGPTGLGQAQRMEAQKAFCIGLKLYFQRRFLTFAVFYEGWYRSVKKIIL